MSGDNPMVVSVVPSSVSVHPHMSGDNINTVELLGDRLGSPPHEWGQFRFTESNLPVQAVHPQMSGDNEDLLINFFD